MDEQGPGTCPAVPTAPMERVGSWPGDSCAGVGMGWSGKGWIFHLCSSDCQEFFPRFWISSGVSIWSIPVFSPKREIKLRNYDPEDEELKKRKLPPAKPASVEDTVKEQLEAAKPEPIIDEVDLANLAPRKPDWDLKRDVSKKLEKLEKRTQRAIAELIRERLKGQEEELASAVGSAKQEGSDSD
ncbi:coiled-coil domain-containing protein 12 isoform X2 [Aphelocoma coerulescens]